MKNLIKLLSLILMMALFQTASAQDSTMKGGTPEQRAQLQTAWMKDKLALNETQVGQVSAINLKYAKMNDPVLKGSDNKFSKFKKLKAAQKDKEKELKGILAPDQFTKYLAMQDEMKDKMKNRKSK